MRSLVATLVIAAFALAAPAGARAQMSDEAPRGIELVAPRHCCCGDAIHQGRSETSFSRACCCELRAPDRHLPTDPAHASAAVAAPALTAPVGYTVVTTPQPVAPARRPRAARAPPPPGSASLLVQHTSHLL
jgi:hypothetical protein